MEPYETIEYRGREIGIFNDSDPMNPRKEYDNLGTMVCWHGRYNLGDEQRNDSAFDWMQEILEVEEETVDRWLEMDLVPSERLEAMMEKKFIILPLYLYDHSGITMKTSAFSCGWDSGRVGFIYMLMKDARKNWKGTAEEVKAKALDYLRGEVKTYDMYLTGNVYGYDTGNDSCWGFYGSESDGEDGSWNYMVQCAKDAIDWDIKHERTEHFKALKTQIKNHVPLRLRKPMAA